MLNPRFKVEFEVEYPGFKGMTEKEVEDMRFEIIAGIVQQFNLTMRPTTIKVVQIND